jgi:hypothetical protein
VSALGSASERQRDALDQPSWLKAVTPTKDRDGRWRVSGYFIK